MLDLSIVIVNYNVKEFLSQCLDSIYQSKTNYGFEVIVVDNQSSDSGEAEILSQFPKVRWINNDENLGFGKANNVGFQAAKGTYTLILNPDTVLRSDTLEKSIDYLNSHPEVGGLGIQGIDGSGRFLPESKRALPTPLVALWKISGLSALFPTSKTFAKYHLGHLSKDENHEVDILVGCYMMVPTKLLLEVGGFDPRYFMYGEDIDLSYELQKTGKKNMYFAESIIIHYKGESTKRGSLNYVRMFYQAMVLFARKQFSGGSALAYTLLIYTGIYLRAGLAILARLGRSAAAPLIDAAVLAIVLEQLKSYWESNHRFINGGAYPEIYTYYVQGSYVLVWILGLWFSGTYSKHARPAGVVRSMIVATLLLGFGYGLLPEDLRFSRALLVLGATGGTVAVLAWRTLLEWLTKREFFAKPLRRPRLLFVGGAQRKLDLEQLLAERNISPAIFIHHENPSTASEHIKNLVDLHQINECVVDSSALSNAELMQIMEEIGHKCAIKTFLAQGNFLVGSNSSLTQGEAYGGSVFQAANPVYVRQKRSLDILIPMLMLATLPLSAALLFGAGRGKLWMKILGQFLPLLNGRRTLVGYSPADAQEFNLPTLPAPIFDIRTGIPKNLDVPQSAKALVINYAREATVGGDWKLLWKLSKK